jgi:hypothetical protein
VHCHTWFFLWLKLILIFDCFSQLLYLRLCFTGTCGQDTLWCPSSFFLDRSKIYHFHLILHLSMHNWMTYTIRSNTTFYPYRISDIWFVWKGISYQGSFLMAVIYCRLATRPVSLVVNYKFQWPGNNFLCFAVTSTVILVFLYWVEATEETILATFPWSLKKKRYLCLFSGVRQAILTKNYVH